MEEMERIVFLLGSIAAILTFVWTVIWGIVKAIKTKKALISAVICITPAAKTIKIHNIGQSAAKNIRIEECGSEVINFDNKNQYPLLEHGESFELFLSQHKDGKRTDVIRIKFTWDDKFRKNNKREQTLIL
jgi:hypothetical protein